MKKDKINVLTYKAHSMAFVFDGYKRVAIGNYHDFHPGCHGLKKYKNVNLKNFFGYMNLAQMLSNGLNKPINKIELTKEAYEKIMLWGIDKKIKNYFILIKSYTIDTI